MMATLEADTVAVAVGTMSVMVVDEGMAIE